MPVTFLSRQHRRRYGRYDGDPDDEQLARYFHLNDVDLAYILPLRPARNRLDFALQLCTVRFLGTFLDKPAGVPASVVNHVAAQLDITRAHKLQSYAPEQTRRRHAREIKARYGYRDFSDTRERFRLVRWLYTRAWLSEERPSVLFDLATARLVERKILLPGATTLERLVARVRERAARRLWDHLVSSVSQTALRQLEALLTVREGELTSAFDQLHQAPTRISGPALAEAVERVNQIRILAEGAVRAVDVPPNRIRALADQASKVKAQGLRRMERKRRLAMLLAFVIKGEATTTDDALDIFDGFMTDAAAKAKSAVEKKRLAQLQDQDAAAMVLVAACTPLLDEVFADKDVRRGAFNAVSQAQLRQAIETVSASAKPKKLPLHVERIAQHYRLRPFLSAFLQMMIFDGMPEGGPVLRALAFLRSIEGKRKPDLTAAPRSVIPRSWRSSVITEAGDIDRHAYTMYVLEQLTNALRRREVFAVPSERWNDPRIKLLHGERRERLRGRLCHSLGRDPCGERELERLSEHLDDSYRRAIAALPSNEDVTIQHMKGHDRLVVTRLDKIEETPSLLALRDAVDRRLPHVDLPEVLLEVQARTQFASAFTHISERDAAINEFPISLCAVLVAEACNTGRSPISRPDVRALTRSRLNWVDQNYLRPETITRANARLVNEQAKLPLAQLWDGGDLASADGLRFRTPTRTVHAGPNPKYFGIERGITWINFTSGFDTGVYGIVVPGTLRDSFYILEGLLEHQTDLEPTEIMSDSTGASEIVFALVWLLGYQFSPRLADIGGARFCRIEAAADYGVFNDLSRHRVRVKLILAHWGDILRIVGSLKRGTISASELMRSLLRTKRPSPVARGLRELGRIVKTLHHLNYISDPVYRRRMLTQLNHHENRHRLTRRVYHGKRGEVRKHYREGQEEQLGVLGLVVNAIVLWNTIYTQEALEQLRVEGFTVKDEDAARLQPHRYSNVNVLGRYSFELPAEIANGALRPLRDPTRTEL